MFKLPKTTETKNYIITDLSSQQEEDTNKLALELEASEEELMNNEEYKHLMELEEELGVFA